MIRKKLLTLLISASVGVLFLMYLSYSEYGNISSLVNYVFAAIIGIANGFLLTSENKRIDRWISWKNNMGLRFLLGVFLNLITSATIIVLIVILFLFFLSNSSFGEIASNIPSLWIKFGIILLFAIIVYNVIYYAQYSYNQYAFTQIEALKNDRKQLKLQFEVLKSQLSPHYLFNSLNTISSLVYKEANQAENFIRRLAQTYEYILSKNSHKFVTLSEEIEFVKSYNYLLQVRFENNIHLEIDVPEEYLSSKIPPLTLQMLIENAVKHNKISEDQPIYITVKMDGNSNLQVVNTKTSSVTKKTSFEIGLTNIKKRYSLLIDKKIRIDDGEEFKVTLPIITSLNLKTA